MDLTSRFKGDLLSRVLNTEPSRSRRRD